MPGAVNMMTPGDALLALNFVFLPVRLQQLF